MFEWLNAERIEQGKADARLSSGRRPIAPGAVGTEHRQTHQLSTGNIVHVV
jgi:hypothetical protein